MQYRSLCHATNLRAFTIITALVLILTLTACGGGFSPPAPTTQPVAVVVEQVSPTITLSPPNGYAALYIQVTGAGWPPNMMVIVVLSDPNGISTTVATKDTDSAGNLSTGFLYPIDTRWLLSVPYTVAAESANGQYQASAQFWVVEPGAETTPSTVASATLTAVPTLIPTVTQPTATAVSATFTPIPTSTTQPVVEDVPTPQNSENDSLTTNQPPIVTARFAPEGEQNGLQERFSVEVMASDPDDNLSEVVALLQIPYSAKIVDVKLKVKDKIEIKMDRGKFEISAPDPQAIFDTLQRDGGIRVQPGQRIEYKTSPEHKFKIIIEDEMLKIEASILLLQATAIDDAGLSSQITASPLAASTEEDRPRRRDNDNGTEDEDDDDNDD